MSPNMEEPEECLEAAEKKDIDLIYSRRSVRERLFYSRITND